jgi:2-oxoglutarate ferredoxin oxidoreductase subunit gamma
MERNLMVAGFGGQGVMTMGKLLSQATCDSTDLNVTFFPSYGAAMRGGTANCYVVISDEEIGAPVSNSVDDLIVMNGPSLHKFLPNLKPGGTLFINSSIVKDPIDRDDIKVISVPVTEMALEMGNPRILNIIMLGAYIGYTNAVPPEVVTAGIHHKFEHKPKVIPLNDKAFETGIEIGKSQN